MDNTATTNQTALRTFLLLSPSVLYVLARAYCCGNKEHMHRHARTNAAVIISFAGIVGVKKAWEELTRAKTDDIEPSPNGYRQEGMRLFRYADEQLRETDAELAGVLGEARQLGMGADSLFA